MTKPNKDGWIRHRGGNCPVDGAAIIDVRLANGDIYKGDKAEDWRWNHEDCMREFRLMAWRPHKTVEQRIIEAEQSALADKCNEEAEMPAAKYFDGPIQWRDRIRELDEQREEVCALYNRQVAEIKEERASLVAKLKAEGFALIQSDEPNSELESAQDDIAQQDMSDPANWRVGDLVKSVYDEGADILIGGVYPLWKEPDIDGDCLYLIDSDGYKRNRCIEDYEFHSRPH